MFAINIAGLLLIAMIVWWFWLYKPASVTSTENLTVVVNNGVYNPSRIQIPANQPFTLEFLREDSSPCAEMLLIPALDISETLPVDKLKAISLPPLAVGVYQFHCQMQMYKGELVVE